MAIDNRTIGRFQLTGIPPAPRGVPQIEVAFDIDANGILNVAAKDKATAKEQTIRIEASSGMTEQEIERMVKDAQAHASEDKAKREEAETRNRADQMVYETEKNLNEMGDKLDEDSRAKLQAALDRTREALKGSDLEEIKSSQEALTQTWNEIAQKLYQTQAGQQQEAAGAAGAKQQGESDAEVVDADYEVVDDEDKEDKEKKDKKDKKDK